MRILSIFGWSALMAVLAMAMTVPALPTTAANAQSSNDDEPTEQQIARHYSLYYENFRNENYQRAIDDLEWILENAPGFPRDDDRNYIRALEAYQALTDETEDQGQRQEYLNKALEIHLNAPEMFEEQGLGHRGSFWWNREFGRFLQMYGDELEEAPMTYADAYRAAFEEDPEGLDIYFIDRIIQDYLNQDDRESALEFMDRVEETRGDDQEIADMILETRDGLFESPEERYDFVESRLAGDPNNVELLRERFELEQQLGMRSEMFETADQLLELEPSAESYFDVGEMYMDDGEPGQAMEYFENALEQPDADEGNMRRDILYRMGVAERQQNNLQASRTQFRRALDEDSSFGEAYIAIGDLIVNAVSECTAGTLEREDRAVYWLAVDYYERAREVDSSVASSAEQKIRTFQQYFPTQEALFFRGWEVGESYSIDYGCYSWINETTTVRRPTS